MMWNPNILFASLLTASASCIVAPLVFANQMPQELRTLWLGAGVALSAGLGVAEQTGAFDDARHLHKARKRSLLAIREQEIADEELRIEQQMELRSITNFLLSLEGLPPRKQEIILREKGMSQYLPLLRDPDFLVQAPPPPAVKAEPEKIFDSRLRWGDNIEEVIERATAPAETVSNDTFFKEIDLGKGIAQMICQVDTNASPLQVLLACPARTGKTTLQTVTIAWLHKLTNGRSSVKIYNGKENRKKGKLVDTFLGLAHDPTRYKSVETPEQAAEFTREMKKLTSDMKDSPEYPEVLIIDEYNNIRTVATIYDKEHRLSKANSFTVDLDVAMSRLVTQGTSRNRFVIMSSHSAYVKNIGIDLSLQDSLCNIVLGRPGNMKSIYKALRGNTSAIVQDTVRAAELIQQLQMWEGSPSKDSTKVVALTNLIDTNYGLYFVKKVDLEGIAFINGDEPEDDEDDEEEDPYETWDAEFEEDNGHQPEDDPDWEKTNPQPSKPSKSPNGKVTVPSKSKAEMTVAEFHAALREWADSLGRSPTDEEVKAKAKELTAYDYTDKGIQDVRKDAGI